MWNQSRVEVKPEAKVEVVEEESKEVVQMVEEPESLSVSISAQVIDTSLEQAAAEQEAELVPLSEPEREQISDALAMAQDEAMAKALYMG